MLKTVPITVQAQGTLTSANTDYTILPTKNDRQLLIIQNTHSSQSMYVFFDGAAYSSGLRGYVLAAGSTLRFDTAIPNGSVHAASGNNSTTYALIEA